VRIRSALRDVILPATAIAAAVGIVTGALVALGMNQRFQDSAVDGFFPRGSSDNGVAVVALDPTFFRKVELDPIGTYSTLLTSLADMGPETLIVQRSLIDTAQVQIADTQGGDVTGLLATAFRTLPDAGVFPLSAGRLDAPRDGSRLPVRTQAALASPVGQAAAATGIDTTTTESPEAAMRTLPLAVEFAPVRGASKAGGVVPSLTLLAWIRAEGLEPTITEHDDALVVGGRRVPTEGGQELRISYSSGLLPGGDSVVKASDILADRVPAEWLRGKVVVAGGTDAAYEPEVPVPVGGGRVPAVYVQANALNTLLTNAYLVPDGDAVTLIAVVVLAFAVALLVFILPLWASPLPALGAAGLWWLFAARRFDDGHVTDLLYPLVAIAVTFVIAAGWKGLREFRERRRVSQMFSRYVPEPVAKELLEPGQADTAAAGRRLDVAILFCDLRGFTAMSGQLEPPQVREILDVYFEATSQIILGHGGTVLRFVGDEVLAVFGAPLPQPDHVKAALQCALDLLDRAPALHAQLAERGLPPVDYGIGLHAGEVIAAHVGSTAHRQYDLVGDAANVGSRLCGQAGQCEVVTSGEVMTAAGLEVHAEPMGVLELKGASGRIAGYRLRSQAVPNGTPVTSGAGSQLSPPARS
jgi:adenylate cyclase